MRPNILYDLFLPPPLWMVSLVSWPVIARPSEKFHLALLLPIDIFWNRRNIGLSTVKIRLNRAKTSIKFHALRCVSQSRLKPFISISRRRYSLLTRDSLEDIPGLLIFENVAEERELPARGVTIFFNNGAFLSICEFCVRESVCQCQA